MEVCVGTRVMWPDLKENIPAGGKLFSNDDPLGKNKKGAKNTKEGAGLRNLVLVKIGYSRL